MVKRTLLATLTVILVPLLLWAWEEPDNFQGLRFGVDVTQAMPECLQDTPSAQQRQTVEASRARCWQKVADDRVILHNVGPMGEVGVYVMAEQVAHKLAQVSVIFSSPQFPRVLSWLQAQYGGPTATATHTWTLETGASLTTATATWVGKRLVISVAERVSEDPLGVILYETDLIRAHRAP